MPPRDADASASPSAGKAADPPGPVEATALAVAGPAFAASLLLLRGTTDLATGVFDAGAAVLVAVGLAGWAHRLRGAAVATGVRGAGLLVGLGLLSTALVPPFYAGVGPAAVALVGGTLLQANARRARPTLALDSAGVACLALAFGLGLFVAGDFPEPNRLRLALVVVLTATVAGLALRRVLLERGHAWLAPMPLGILLVSTLGGVYLSYRTLVREHVENLPLYEWTLAAAAAWLLLARLRRRAKEREVAGAWTGLARRHAQDVRPVYDARMGPLAAAIGRYLEQGVGYDAYREAMLRAGASPAMLDAMPRGPQGRTRAARREAAKARLEAHERIRSTNQSGPLGSPQRPVRPNP